MTINVGWHERDETVIRIDFIGNWSLEEYYDMLQRADKLVRDSGKRIKCLFIDLSLTGVVPRNVMAGYKKVILSGKIPVIFLKIDASSRMMVDSLRKTYAGTRPIYFVETPAEADAMLDQIAAGTGETSL
jgi:hypothetical protein